MNPSPADSSELPVEVRQKLVLAQVRLLELEDNRAELATRVDLLDRLLSEAQALANGKIAERDHSVRVAAEAEAQARELHAQLAALRESLAQAQAALGSAEQIASDRQARIDELETVVRAMKSSRSWRWTAPLRAIERLFRRHPR